MSQTQSKGESPQEQTNLQEREEYKRNLAKIFEGIDNLQRRTEHQAEIMKRQEDINERLTSMYIAMNSVVQEKMSLSEQRADEVAVPTEDRRSSSERARTDRQLSEQRADEVQVHMDDREIESEPNSMEVQLSEQRADEVQVHMDDREIESEPNSMEVQLSEQRADEVQVHMDDREIESEPNSMEVQPSEQRADEVAVLTEDRGSSSERARTDRQSIRRWKFPFFWRRKKRATAAEKRSTALQLSEQRADEVQVHMDDREIESEPNSMEVQLSEQRADEVAVPTEDRRSSSERARTDRQKISCWKCLTFCWCMTVEPEEERRSTALQLSEQRADEVQVHMDDREIESERNSMEVQAESHLSRLRESDDATTTSSDDSFFSADEVLDAFSPEDASQSLRPLALYEEALALAREGRVAYRSLRTDLLECGNDEDFLAKLHCVRQAFQVLLRDDAHRAFFRGTGRQLITGLMHKANKSPEAFLESYEDMMRYIQREETWATTKEELEGQQVVCMNFFDIVLDFIVMGAFEGLENQPSYIVHGIKIYSAESQEKKLKKACRSFLEAKRHDLLVLDGFLSHYYAICEHLSPVLAIGFLGPRPQLREVCKIFKQQIVQYLRDMFDHDKVRFTTAQSLADDILRLSHQRSEILLGDLCISSLSETKG